MFLHVLRSTWRVLVVLFAVYFICAWVFWLAERPHKENLGFGDALYYGVVTISTVGYGDIVPVTVAGRLAAITLILFALTSIGTILTKVTNAVLEAKRMEELGMNGTRFQGHLVLVGWSRIAKVTLTELVAVGRQVAVICDRTDDLVAIRGLGKEDQIFVTVGDLSSEAVLERAGVRQAHAVIVCTDDDTQNLILTLNVRSYSPSTRIIVSVQREELRKTLSASGVTYVASPFEFSGRLVASAAFEPEVARFVEDISSGLTGEYDLQEYAVPQGSTLAEKSVKEIANLLEEREGPLLVGMAALSGTQWKIRPHPPGTTRVSAGDILIVLGNDDQNARFAALVGATQGR